MARYNGSDSSAEKKVMLEVVGAGRDGIWQKDVARQAELDRSYVSEIASWLQSHGKITIVRIGNRAKYYAKIAKVRDPVLGPFLQGRYAFGKLVKKRRAVLGRDVLEIKVDNLSKMQLSLLMFSLSLGVSITYLLLQATSKGNRILAEAYYGSSERDNTGKKPEKFLLTPEQRERMIRDWIKGAMSSMVPLMPSEFLNMVYDALAQAPLSYEDKKKLLDRVTHLEMDEATAQQVYRAFESILDPRTARALQRISDGLTKLVENEIRFIEKAERGESRSRMINSSALADLQKQKYKQNRRHRHKFNVTEVRGEHYYETCEICGLERPSRRSPESNRR